MLDALWEKVLALIISAGAWMFEKTDMTLQWIGKWASPLYQWFLDEDFYVLMLLGGTIVFVVLAGVMLSKIPFTTKKEDEQIEHENYNKSYRAARNLGIKWVSLVEYVLGLTWLVAMGSTQECKGFNGFMDMYMPQGVQMSFFNFSVWRDPIKYLCIFILLRFMLSVVGGVLRREFLRLLRFLIISLACVFTGMTGGFILSFLNEFAASGFIGSVVTVPIFFLVYTIPAVWIYTPPAIVAGHILLIMISPFVGILKFFFGDGGSSTGGDGSDFSMTLVYTEVFSDTGKLLYSFTDLFTHI